MLEQLFIYITGYLKLRITNGDWNRFLNLCKANHIFIQKLSRRDDAVEFMIDKKYQKQLVPFLTKCQIEYQVIQETGIFYYIKKYRKKVCFFLGILLFFSCILYSSKFVWNISVDGESVYTDEEIIRFVESEYVRLGTRKSSVHLNELERELREHYEHVAWVSCEIKGTQLQIHMVETISQQNIVKKDSPCNVVAIKDGMITDITAKSGTKLKQVGDEVKRGDILISGVVNLYNEYEELIETTCVTADGLVYARTRYPYEQKIELDATKKVYTGKKSSGYGIEWFGKTFSFKKGKTKSGHDLIVEKYPLHFGNSFYLPISFVQSQYFEYTIENVSMTEEQAKEKQEELLEKYLADLRKKGVEILENNVKIDLVNDVSIASGNIVVRELIGTQEIITDITDITDLQEGNEEPQ